MPAATALLAGGRAVSAPACLRSPRSGFEFKSAGRQTIPQKNIPIPSVTSPSHTAHRGGSAPPHRAHPQRQASSSTPHHPPLSAAQQSMTHSSSTAPSFVYHDTSCFQFAPLSVPHPLTLLRHPATSCFSWLLTLAHLHHAPPGGRSCMAISCCFPPHSPLLTSLALRCSDTHTITLPSSRCPLIPSYCSNLPQVPVQLRPTE